MLTFDKLNHVYNQMEYFTYDSTYIRDKVTDGENTYDRFI